MKKITVNGKNIYIVNSHNQVLEAWEMNPGCNIFSLDYHTDTKEAFHTYSYWRADSEMKSGRCSNHEVRKRELTDQKINRYLEKKITIKQINDNLRHDEHLDFAVRTQIVGRVFVLSKNRNATSSNPNVYIVNGQKEYMNHRILEYSAPCYSQCQTIAADFSLEDSVLELAVRKAESFDHSFFKQYILDIDCDYFNTEKSLYPVERDFFNQLIREAEFITIALEPECVKICRHAESQLTSEMILSRLISMIEDI